MFPVNNCLKVLSPKIVLLVSVINFTGTLYKGGFSYSPKYSIILRGPANVSLAPFSER